VHLAFQSIEISSGDDLLAKYLKSGSEPSESLHLCCPGRSLISSQLKLNLMHSCRCGKLLVPAVNRELGQERGGTGGLGSGVGQYL
jgi:hypothetical protein